MQVKTMALLLVLASLAGLAPTTPVRAGSCSHCVFDDDAPMQPAPKRTVG